MVDEKGRTQYAHFLPDELPDGVLDWLIEQGQLAEQLWIYKQDWQDDGTGKKERMCRIHCTACGETIWVPVVEGGCRWGSWGFHHPTNGTAMNEGTNGYCHICGSYVKAIHSGDVNKYGTVTGRTYVTTVHRVGGGYLALCEWVVMKYHRGDGTHYYNSQPYEACVVTDRGMVRCTARSRTFGHEYFIRKWKQVVKFVDEVGKTHMVFPWDKSILEGTPVEHSKLDLYLDMSCPRYPVAYLKLWRKCHAVETLLLSRGGYLLADLIERVEDVNNYQYDAKVAYNILCKKERRPAQLLGLNKEEYHRCILELWSIQHLEVYRMGKKFGETLDSAAIKEAVEFGVKHCREFVELGENPVYAIRYLDKQRKKDGRGSCYILTDYWRMAQVAEYDLDDNAVKYPPNLIRAHDRVMTVKKKLDTIAADKKISARIPELERFSWERDGIFIRPARSVEELNAEGKKLHHCVGTYAERMASGEKSIFFIRKVDAPEVPWYTLDLDMSEGTINQNRGNHNCATTEEVKTFATAWLERIKPLLNKTKKGKVA